MTNSKQFAFFLGCIMPNRYPQIEASTKYVMKTLGYGLYSMEKAACCPAPGVLRSFNKVDWMVAGARNICIAEKMDMDILTVCNGCFGTLQGINHHLKEDENARVKVNAKLKELGDYQFKGTIEVRHIAHVLASDVGDSVKDHLVRKVDLKAAIHYGCHFLKPTFVRELASSEKPTLLEDYFELLGVKSLKFKDKYTCCGAGGGVKAAFAKDSMTIFKEKMVNITEVNPDIILDICPFCHLQFETGQDYWNKNGQTFNLPVVHISQLTAYCMGLEAKLLGWITK